ncbi:CZB domain-containing protein [Rufibacter tibetensis]|uniref:Chemoreceptor zinc-binding domain-containing protein n=1 Tax=Rufibacter tibetensis TaxID=512763 RepID=A0A0P0C3W1_9BACT|nr:CZB domain-containing protein [Rufibacter tibetensis]ALI99806.1 hypothetical protein DC20_13515 [Rufibacter tibetensis]
MNTKEQNDFCESIGRLDFEQARIKHVLFKSKLRALLYGADIDPAPVVSTTGCSLGKWIYEVAMPRIGHMPEVKDLERIHNDMHAIAHRLLQEYQQGKQEQALKELQKVDDTAQKLLHLLDVIERRTIV